MKFIDFSSGTRGVNGMAEKAQQRESEAEKIFWMIIKLNIAVSSLTQIGK